MFRNTKYLDKSLPYKISVPTTSRTTMDTTTTYTTTTSGMGTTMGATSACESTCESACEYNVIQTWPKNEWTPSFDCNKPLPLEVGRLVCEFSVKCNLGSITCSGFIKYCLNVFLFLIILVK